MVLNALDSTRSNRTRFDQSRSLDTTTFDSCRNSVLSGRNVQPVCLFSQRAKVQFLWQLTLFPQLPINMSTKAELACVYAALVLVDDDVTVTVSIPPPAYSTSLKCKSSVQFVLVRISQCFENSLGESAKNQTTRYHRDWSSVRAPSGIVSPYKAIFILSKIFL